MGAVDSHSVNCNMPLPRAISIYTVETYFDMSWRVTHISYVDKNPWLNKLCDNMSLQ
jgi:hypothetical protein